jgi:hypothetical protein
MRNQIKEALRYFPAVAWNLPRWAPEEGITIAGQYFGPGVNYLFQLSRTKLMITDYT